MMRTVFLLVALSIPQFCYSWLDQLGAETLCRKARVVQIAPHRFKVTIPVMPRGAVTCRIYRDYHIIGTISAPTGDQCDGFILDGMVLDDKKAPELVLAH